MKIHGSWRIGVSPTNFQIKCLIPCLHCGKDKPVYKKVVLKNRRTFCSASCQIKWQNQNTDFNKGKNNPSYEHGLRVNGQFPQYGEGFNKETRRIVKIRDRFCCQKCSENFSGSKSKYLDVHHIDHNKYNNNSSNLISLCKKCHTKVHWEEGKNDWI